MRNLNSWHQPPVVQEDNSLSKFFEEFDLPRVLASGYMPDELPTYQVEHKELDGLVLRKRYDRLTLETSLHPLRYPSVTLRDGRLVRLEHASFVNGDVLIGFSYRTMWRRLKGVYCVQAMRAAIVPTSSRFNRELYQPRSR